MDDDKEKKGKPGGKKPQGNGSAGKPVKKVRRIQEENANEIDRLVFGAANDMPKAAADGGNRPKAAGNGNAGTDRPGREAAAAGNRRPVSNADRQGSQLRKGETPDAVRRTSSDTVKSTAGTQETVKRTTGSAKRPAPAPDSAPVNSAKRAAEGSGSASARPAGSAPRRPVGNQEGLAVRSAGGTGYNPGNVSSRPAGSAGGSGSAPRRPAGGAGGSGSGPRKPSGGSGSGPRKPDGTKAKKQLTPDEIRRKEYLKLKKQREKKRNIVLAICGVLVFILIAIGIVWSINNSNPEKQDGTKTVENVTNGATKTPEATPTPSPTNTPTPTPTPEPVSVVFVAVGDDLVHQGVYKSGFQADGTRNYDHLFAQTKYLMEDADIAVMNQETIFGSAQGNNDLKSYPSFNSPVELTDALVNAGFNVVTHATNHAYDMGIDGLLYSAKYWKEHHPETLVLGIYETEEEQNEIPILEVNGIKFAMLNYTYSHNWSTFAKPAEGHLNMLCPYDPETRVIDFNSLNPRVIEDIKKAEEIADFTIVFPHWGTEYVNDHTAVQENMAKQMTEAGADLIVGTHPHVIEPVVWITSDNGNRSLCYYSLGNYTSTQDEVLRLLGGMAKLTITKDVTGTYIDENTVKAIPLVTHYQGSGNLAKGTYSLANYTPELAKAHGITARKGNTEKYKVTVEKFTEHAQKVFGEYCCIE